MNVHHEVLARGEKDLLYRMGFFQPKIEGSAVRPPDGNAEPLVRRFANVVGADF